MYIDRNHLTARDDLQSVFRGIGKFAIISYTEAGLEEATLGEGILFRHVAATKDRLTKLILHEREGGHKPFTQGLFPACLLHDLVT